MTTPLRGAAVVRREVAGTDGAVYIVSLTNAGLTVREKGRRQEYGPLPYAWLHQRGAEQLAEETRRRRAAIKARPRSIGR